MRYFLALLLICCAAAHAAPLHVAILDDGPAVGDLQRLYQHAGYSVDLMKEADLAGLRAPDAAIFVVPPKSVFPPNGRKHLHRYLTEGGNLAVLSPKAFDYMPRPIDPKPIVDFSRDGGYTIAKPQTARSEVIDVPASRHKGIRLTSEFMAHGDLSVSIPLEPHRAADRGMVCVKAKGDYDIDILMLTLEDDAGAKYVAFSDLARGWKDYAVPMADFAPISEDKEAPSINPSRAKTLTISASTRVVWKGARGYLAVGPVSLAKSSRFPGVTTSQVLKWRAACVRTKAVFRDWAIDPFLDARRLTGPSWFDVDPSEDPYGSGAAWEIPDVPAYRGFEEGKVEDVVKLAEYRRKHVTRHLEYGKLVPICEVRTFSDGPYKGASMVLIGIEGVRYRADNPLGGKLIEDSGYVTSMPRIVKVTPATTPSGVEPTEFVVRVKALNPRGVKAPCRLSINVANGRLLGEKGVVLPPRELSEIEISLGQVGQDFPMEDFTWQAELRCGSDRDGMSDGIDVERSIIQAAKYAINLQKHHRDGRYSIYFFTDIYTARMLFALSGYLADPDVWNRNRDLLVGMKPSDFADSAFRFCDMIASKQSTEGAIPIGYSDHRGDMFTADDGTIVMGMLQIASWLPKGDPRAQRYLDVARKYFAFRESLYITPEKSRRLQEQFGPGATGTTAGWYGVGILSTDLFKEGQEIWPALAVEERGYHWVLSISMGAVAGLQLLDPSNPDYGKVVLRDANEIITKDYPISKSSHFHVECLYWMLQAIDDPQVRQGLIRKIEQSMPHLLGGNEMLLYFEGRGALNWLNLAYYREKIGDDSRTRAATLSGVWSLCSESSSYSMRRMADQFPMTTFRPPIGAYRYIVHGSIALVEMLDPGSTFLRPQ